MNMREDKIPFARFDNFQSHVQTSRLLAHHLRSSQHTDTHSQSRADHFIFWEFNIILSKIPWDELARQLAQRSEGHLL